MSEGPPEPLAPELAALFAREADAYVENPEAKAKVLAGVSRSVLLALPLPVGQGGAAGSSAGQAAAGARAGRFLATLSGAKAIVIAGAVFVAGGATGALVERSIARPSSLPGASSSATPEPSPVPSSVPSGSPVPPIPVAPPVPSPAPSPPPSAAPLRSIPSAPAPGGEKTGTLAREREVLDAARAALSHGQWADALSAVHDHETRWPHGALEEEREVLAIQALAGSGRKGAACDRAARFRRSFPESMLSDAVTSSLGNCDEGP